MTLDEIEAAAKAWYCCQHSIMHDHDENWRTFPHRALYLECAKLALMAAERSRTNQ